MSHKIAFNFDKKKVSISTAEFLLGIFNPIEEESETKDHLQKALEGTALKVKDANSILQLILTAMIIDDNEGDEAIINELKNDKAALVPMVEQIAGTISWIQMILVIKCISVEMNNE